MTEYIQTRAVRFARKGLFIGVVSAICGVAGCASSLLPTPASLPARFNLDDGSGVDVVSTNVPSVPTSGLTLMVAVPKAAPGFDSAQLVYQRRANELESFAYSEWVEPPARMLAPMLRRALIRTGAFAAVIDASMAAAADLRLDSEIVRLQQDFTTSPSRAELTLLVTVVDLKTRRIVVSRQFDATEPAATDDARGSVAAANRVVARLVADAATFVAGSIRH